MRWVLNELSLMDTKTTTQRANESMCLFIIVPGSWDWKVLYTLYSPRRGFIALEAASLYKE